jgi:hypothetical protein
MSLNAVSKHVKVLEKAGLLQRWRQGREHTLELNAAPAAGRLAVGVPLRALLDRAAGSPRGILRKQGEETMNYTSPEQTHRARATRIPSSSRNQGDARMPRVPRDGVATEFEEVDDLPGDDRPGSSGGSARVGGEGDRQPVEVSGCGEASGLIGKRAAQPRHAADGAPRRSGYRAFGRRTLQTRSVARRDVRAIFRCARGVAAASGARGAMPAGPRACERRRQPTRHGGTPPIRVG